MELHAAPAESPGVIGNGPRTAAAHDSRREFFNSDGVFGNDKSLVLVNPETIVRWHRAGFRLYWSLISWSRRRVGRKKPSKEVRDLIFQMVAPEPDLGRASHSRGFSYGGNRRPLMQLSSRAKENGDNSAQVTAGNAMPAYERQRYRFRA